MGMPLTVLSVKLELVLSMSTGLKPLSADESRAEDKVNELMLLNQIESYDPTDNHNLSIKAKVESIRIEDLLGRKPIDTHNPAVSDSVRDRTVMITGAAGSIGSEITRQIAGMKPGRIVLVDQAETPMHELQSRRVKCR